MTPKQAPRPVEATAVTPRPRYQRGDYIGDSLQVFGVLGEGGFGIVYHVASFETGQALALKALRSELLRDERALAMFRKEAQIWIELGRHPYLVKAEWMDEIGGRLYLAMELVRGVPGKPNSLEGYLEKGLVTEELALRWAIEFCHGMEHAFSRGVRCHRDIKPANVLIGSDSSVRISDFGIAGLALVPDKTAPGGADDASEDAGVGRTVVGSVFGTSTHMSPEQFVDAASCDERSDVYSFGVVLHQLATGRLPFLPPAPPRGMPPMPFLWHAFREMHQKAPLAPVDSPLHAIVARCLQKAPALRYPSFRALREDVEALYERQTGKAPAAAPTLEDSVADLVNRGMSLASLGRFEEAVASYDRALAKAPDAKAIHNNKGNALRQLGRVPEALASFDRAIELDPEFDEAWSNKGLLFASAGRHAEALACFERATAYDARNADAWVGKAHCLCALGRDAEALACLDRATGIDPRNANAWYNRGVALSGSDRAQALRSYERALEANPRYAQAWAAKGLALGELGRGAEAIACFDEALRVEPTLTQAHYNKGNVLIQLGRMAEARDAFDAATRQPDAIPVCWYNRGLAEYQMGQVEQAQGSLQEFLRRAAPSDPLAPGARLMLQKLAAGERPQISSGKGARRIELKDAPTVALPKDASVAVPGAQPKAPQEAPRRDLPTLPPLPKDRPAGTPGEWNARAASLYGEDHFQEALACAERAVRLDPKDAVALNNLSNALFKLGRNDQALAAQERVLLAQPAFLGSWLNRGAMEQQLGRRPEALRTLLDLLEIARAGGEESESPFARQARGLVAGMEKDGVRPAPRTHLGWLGLGFQAMVRKSPDRALSGFDRAIAMAPDLPAVREWKASALRELERYDDALACVDEAIARAPQNAELHHERGMILARMQRHEEAIAAWDRAVELDPEHTASWSDRGKTLGVLGRLAEGVASLTRANELRPDHPAPWQNRAMNEEQLGWLEEAARSHEEFLKRATPDMRLQIEHAKARLEVIEGKLRARRAPPAVPPPPTAPASTGKPPVPPAALAGLVPFAGVDSETIRRVAKLMEEGRDEEALDLLAKADTRPPQSEEEKARDQALLDVMLDAHMARKAAGASSGPGEAVPGPKPARTGNPIAKKYADRGLEQINAGRYQEALEGLDAAIQRDPGEPLYHSNRALALSRAGRLEEALRAYQHALELDPHCVPALVNLAGHLTQARQHREALALVSRAVKVEPESATCWINRGQILLNLEDWLEAARSFERAVRLDQKDGRAWIGAGTALQRLGRSKDALPALEEGLQLVPGDADAWYQKGNALSALGREKQAAESYQRCLEIAPQRANAWYNMATSLLALNRHEDAIAACDRAVALFPGFDRAYVCKGAALDALSRTAEALAAFESALSITPDYVIALANQGYALHKLGRDEDALASVEQALRHDPGHKRSLKLRAELTGPKAPAPDPIAAAQPGADPVVIPEALVPQVVPGASPSDALKKGEIALHQGQVERALEWFDQAIAGDPRSADAWAGKAAALATLKRHAESVAHLDKALALDPRSASGWQSRAAALAALGLHEEALASWDKGLAAAPRSLQLWNGRGLALFALGRDEEALAAFEKAVEVDPRFALAKFNKAQAELRLERRPDAARSFQQFLSLAPPQLAPLIKQARERLQELKGA